ncbi:UvrD-helicase domain-containing protein [Moraxella canis]|uniref:UvrD-helicase domain-containing protein n=1 Tax=Moraxella canis TaxID=90239 RepID=A0ABZ0WXY8_9GAMM|nr:UvrD-helicase domain-containing protein [Moraxella canis]WQE03893.1 UvrD-helicase domain-containing protein [Moraxella canis]
MNNFNLTDEQKDIVEPKRFSSAMIIANAGSGKTNTLVRRAINQTKGIKPWKNIAIISFTNKSAGDILKKVKELNGSKIIAMTFHSFLLHHVLAFNEYFRSQKILFDFNPDNSSSSLEEWLNNVIDRKIMTSSGMRSEKDYLFEYAIECLEKNEYIRKYLKTKFEAIYIDEAQDNNSLQYEIVKLFLSYGIQVVLAGDPQQTIYEFRGASSEKFQSMRNNPHFKDRIYQLSRNFRCHSLIDACAKNYTIPQENSISCEDGTVYGVFVTKTAKTIVDKFSEEKFNNEGLCFLFWSTGKNQSIIEELDLVLVKLPNFIENQQDPQYQNYLDSLLRLYFSKSVEEVYFKDKFLSDIHTNIARKLIQDFKNNLCIDTLKSLNDHAGLINRSDFAEVIECINLDTTRQFYQLDKTQNIAMTIHSAKGLEFRNVVLQKNDFRNIGGSAKMFYVACTRAEKRLFFV